MVHERLSCSRSLVVLTKKKTKFMASLWFVLFCQRQWDGVIFCLFSFNHGRYAVLFIRVSVTFYFLLICVCCISTGLCRVMSVGCSYGMVKCTFRRDKQYSHHFVESFIFLSPEEQRLMVKLMFKCTSQHGLHLQTLRSKLTELDLLVHTEV